MESVASKISCLETGAGNKWYKFILHRIYWVNWPVISQDLIAQDPNTHGAMFVPWIMGSDKTTVSVATSQNKYYPLYGSIRNVRNGVRRAHRDALVLVGFLAIPQSKWPISVFLICTHWIWSSSWQETYWWCKISKILKAALSHIPLKDFTVAKAWYVNNQGSALLRRSLLLCDLWPWTVYGRLPWESTLGLHCAKMVPEVSSSFLPNQHCS